MAMDCGRDPLNRLCLCAAGLWCLLLAAGAVDGYWKLVDISALAALAMGAGAALVGGLAGAGRAVITLADGFGAGVMVASACLFLLPEALHGGAVAGGAGIAVGLAAGAVLQRGARRSAGAARRLAPSVVALSLHALAAGTVLGVVYATMPSMGLLLGVAIVAHKLPAGYVVARKLKQRGQSLLQVLLPATTLGIAALLVAMQVAPGGFVGSGVVFGFGTGIFLAVGLDFLAAVPAGQTRRGGWLGSVAALGGVVLVVLLKQYVV